jgi:hypothetical protein
LDKDPAVMRRAKAAADNVLANAVLVREAGGHLGFVREDIRIALLREAFPAITEAAPIGDPKQP